MPPFAGTGLEKRALAAYIYRELQGKSTLPSVDREAVSLPLEIPPFNPDTSEYVLLVWNDLGKIHPFSTQTKDGPPILFILQPGGCYKPEYPCKDQRNGGPEDQRRQKAGIHKTVPEVAGFEPLSRGQHKTQNPVDNKET